MLFRSGSREGVTSVARFRSGGCEEFSSSLSSFAPSFAGPLRTPRLPDVSTCSAPLPGFGYAACTFLWPERVLASPVLLLLSSCATSPLSLPSTSLDLSPVPQLHRLPLSTPLAPLSPLVLNARPQSPPSFPSLLRYRGRTFVIQAMLRVASLILAVLAAAGTVSAAFSKGTINRRDSSLTVSLLHDDLGRIAQRSGLFPLHIWIRRRINI